MIRKNLLITAMMLIILVIGCRPPTSTSNDNNYRYRTGTSGISMNFLANAPPSKINVDEPYTASIPITLEVRNLGAYPSDDDSYYYEDLWDQNSVIFISGFDDSIITNWYLSGDNPINNLVDGRYPAIMLDYEQQALQGKSNNNPEGGYQLYELTGEVYLGNLDIEKYSPTFLVTACYGYKTKADESVCIDPRPFSTTNENKVCTIHDVSLKSQGAPIAVTKIESKALSNSIQFKIHIQNSGGGDVIALDKLSKCSSQKDGKLQKSDLDLVKIRTINIGNKELECNTLEYDGQTGYIRLMNGKGFVVCNYDYAKESVPAAYSTPIHVELNYGYRTSISKKVEIIKIPNS